MEAAKSIVTKLKLKHFVPVENPSLQSTYRMIEETLSLSSYFLYQIKYGEDYFLY